MLSGILSVTRRLVSYRFQISQGQVELFVFTIRLRPGAGGVFGLAV